MLALLAKHPSLAAMLSGSREGGLLPLAKEARRTRASKKVGPKARAVDAVSDNESEGDDEDSGSDEDEEDDEYTPPRTQKSDRPKTTGAPATENALAKKRIVDAMEAVLGAAEDRNMSRAALEKAALSDAYIERLRRQGWTCPARCVPERFIDVEYEVSNSFPKSYTPQSPLQPRASVWRHSSPQLPLRKQDDPRRPLSAVVQWTGWPPFEPWAPRESLVDGEVDKSLVKTYKKLLKAYEEAPPSDIELPGHHKGDFSGRPAGPSAGQKTASLKGMREATAFEVDLFKPGLQQFTQKLHPTVTQLPPA